MVQILALFAPLGCRICLWAERKMQEKQQLMYKTKTAYSLIEAVCCNT